MTDLIEQDQVDEIRNTMTDIADTFAFPVTLIRTTFVNGAFASEPTTESFSLQAIRSFGSGSETDRYRNALGPAASHEFDLYIGWQSLEDAELVDDNKKILIDHNDLIEMEGEIYEIVAFGGVADMTKYPSFIQVHVRRRFENPNGAESV